MNSVAALSNGALSANQRGSVCPCGLTIGSAFTVAYSARERARCVGSEANRRSGWSSSFMGTSMFASGRRHRALGAVAKQRGEPARYRAGEPRIGGQIASENGVQREQCAGKRLGVTAVRRGEPRELRCHRVGDLDLAAALVDPGDVAHPPSDRERQQVDLPSRSEIVAYGAQDALRQLLRTVHGDLP